MSGSNAFEVELQALRSIYEKDLRVDGDTVIITVHTLQNDPQNDEIKAQIDLQLNCPPNYPDKLPSITFNNCRGLSNKQVTVLSSELEKLAISLCGKPMIYDLACYVLNYLLDNNRPRRKSFYDEMICRKQEEEARFKSDEDRRMKKIYDVQKKVRMKIEENKSSDEDDFESKSHVTPNDDENVHLENTNYGDGQKKIFCNSGVCCNSKYIHFENKVLRGQCIDHLDHRIIYCALDTTTGEQLIVHEWLLKPGQRLSEISQLLESVQNKLNYLKTLKHENLNSYVDFKCISDKDEWTVYIAEKYISDVTLKTFISEHWAIDVDIVRCIVESVLKGILYLHDRKVTHKHLKESDIYVSKSGKIKLSSYSVVKRMDDIWKLCQDGTMPEQNYDQKLDMKQFGFVLKQILELIIRKSDHSTEYTISDLRDFVDKCLIKNEERRWGARELIDHRFLKRNILYETSWKRRSSSSTRKAFETDDDDNEEIDGDNNDNNGKDKYLFSPVEQNSRLFKDFCILEDIGKGSFGKVLKVRNKLDRQIYAIKEIKLDKSSMQLDKKINGEVNLLSKLKHENVVRYYTSWIETYSGEQNLRTENMDNSRDDDDEEEDGEDDDSSDEGLWGTNDEEDGSSSIVFQADDDDDEEKQSLSSSSSEKKENKMNKVQFVRIMYIQMEFCEKSTLKYAINDKLHEQQGRCWRLLREIVEGLTYIHEQGLIHRDLKPDNIFLDSNDHVKIGDFGLAKIRCLPKCTLIITDVSLGGQGDNDTQPLFGQGDSNTAGVGTSYYVAPEMNTTFEKSHYNEKVDIYSLGIIFFEMCHPPFNTGMERHDVLTKLRKPEVAIPAASEDQMPRQMDLIRMLLSRDPASRPTSKEILEDHLPPAEVEFEELKEIVRKALKTPESKCYKYLISSCLNQKISIDEDITYQIQNSHSDKFHMSLELAKEPIESIFKRHGAMYLSTPLLIPQNEVYSNIDARVKLMTQSGAVVNLPYDLRIPFARYVTSKNIRRFRRYTIDRVHREQKLHGVPPKELYECAFDIVSPKIGNLAVEWETLTLMDEVVNDIPSLKNRHCIIVLNHALILRALLMYCNVEKLYSEIFKFLMDAKMNRCGKSQLETNLLSLELGRHVVNTLVTFFEKEDTVYALKEDVLTLLGNGKEAFQKAEKGFDKLIKIIEEVEKYNLNTPIRVRLGVVCNSEYCSDIMFEMVCKTKQKRGKQSTDVIMSGCRYDGLLRNFRKLFSYMNIDTMETNQSAIGVSISLDKIAILLKEDNVLSEKVVVCSTDYCISNKAKTSFVEYLRESGVKCYFEDTIDNMEELMEFCQENKITHIVNMKEENGMVLIMSWDSVKCRYREKKISKWEVSEYILRSSKSGEDAGNTVTYQRMDSKSSSTSSEASSASPSFNIHILVEEKSLTRRKYENQIWSKVSPLMRYFSSKTRIEVVGVHLDEGEIGRIAMSFKHDDDSYKSKITSAADRSSKKAYLAKICAKLESFFMPDKSSVVVMLYGLGHDKYQLIMG